MSDAERDWVERNPHYYAVFQAVKDTMHWDDSKTQLWMDTPNPLFGGAAPRLLIELGRAHKVWQFVLDAATNNTAAEFEQRGYRRGIESSMQEVRFYESRDACGDECLTLTTVSDIFHDLRQLLPAGQEEGVKDE